MRRGLAPPGVSFKNRGLRFQASIEGDQIQANQQGSLSSCSFSAHSMTPEIQSVAFDQRGFWILTKDGLYLLDSGRVSRHPRTLTFGWFGK